MKNAVEMEKIYPLSPMQEGMLLQYLMDHDSVAYCEQSSFTVKGDLNRELLEESFNRLIKRHEALRTVFIHEGVERPVQVVLNPGAIRVTYAEREGLTGPERVKYLNDFELRDRQKGFNLTQAPLTRLAMIKLDDALFKVVWTFPHIIMDGWCMGIVLDELWRIYESLRRGDEPPLNEVHQYSDYIHWLQRQNEKEALEFWRQYLEGYQQKATLPRIRRDNGQDSYLLREHSFHLDEGLTSRLHALAKGCHTTLNVLIQSVWGLLLCRYNNTEDVVFGVVVSGRPAGLEGVENIIGLFINTIPGRVRVNAARTFMELVKAVQESTLQVKPYECCSLAKIQAENGLHQNLFDHILAFENYPGMDELNQTCAGNGKSLTFSEVTSFEQTNYDFNLIVIPGKRMTIKLNYNGKVFHPAIIEMIADHIRTLITGILDDPGVSIRKIDIVTEREKQRILADFNSTEMNFPDQTIHELFEAAAAQYPENIALISEDRRLTYRELNQKANRLAGLLRSQGVKPDTIVAIVAERSMAMVLAVLGILKAGGAYLPIDPEYPEERIRFMLEDSRTKIVVTQRRLAEKYRWEQEVIDLDDETNFEGVAVNPEMINRPQDLAYVIYTSGSTGKPKGVMVEHRSLVNLSTWHNRFYQVTQFDRSTQYAGCGFDAAVWEIFPYMIAGATVHIISQALQLDIYKLNQYYEKNKISISFLPTPICEQFLGLANQSLRALLTGGDKLRKYEARNYRLFNNYGPTENTVVTTSFLVERNYENIPIGKPNANIRIYILDPYDRLQPVAVPGELCVSGAGLARGYLNRPELTAGKFGANPFCPGQKMYRSGDLARWLPDGNIEFLGRMDHQVKIRGFRVEPGEIENRLFDYAGVKEAAVVAGENGAGKYLCAYFVADRKIDLSHLKEYLRANLPVYMVPAHYLQLTEMPLNHSGKIDREKLSGIHLRESDAAEYRESSSETEKQLQEIWRSLLEHDRIGVDEHFFDIGGNSILAVRMHSRIAELYPDQLGIADIFANPTIAKLAKHIEAARGGENRNPVVERMKLPQDYFILEDRTGRTFDLEYTLNGDMWQKLLHIAASAGVEPEVVLLGINAFVYHKISAEKAISIQTMTKTAGNIHPLKIDFSGMRDFDHLFAVTARALQESQDTQTYSLDDAAGLKKTGASNFSITPFFMNHEFGGDREKIARLFELFISVEKGKTYCGIQCGYHPEKLNRHLVSEFFAAYVRTINSAITKYQLNKGRKQWSV